MKIWFLSALALFTIQGCSSSNEPSAEVTNKIWSDAVDELYYRLPEYLPGPNSGDAGPVYRIDKRYQASELPEEILNILRAVTYNTDIPPESPRCNQAQIAELDGFHILHVKTANGNTRIYVDEYACNLGDWWPGVLTIDQVDGIVEHAEIDKVYDLIIQYGIF